MADNSLLASQARLGDMEAFGALYVSVYDDLYRYALYSLRNAHDAEDAVSECVAEAIKGIKGIKDESRFKSWIFAILFRAVKRQFKKRYASYEPIESLLESDGGEGAFDESVVIALNVLDALSQLSEEDRQIVLLSVVGGYKGEEIAKIAKMPHGTVRSKLSRSLAKLRSVLSEETIGDVK